MCSEARKRERRGQEARKKNPGLPRYCPYLCRYRTHTGVKWVLHSHPEVGMLSKGAQGKLVPDTRFSNMFHPYLREIHLRACLTLAILEKYTPKVDSTISTTGCR